MIQKQRAGYKLSNGMRNFSVGQVSSDLSLKTFIVKIARENDPRFSKTCNSYIFGYNSGFKSATDDLRIPLES